MSSVLRLPTSTDRIRRSAFDHVISILAIAALLGSMTNAIFISPVLVPFGVLMAVPLLRRRPDRLTVSLMAFLLFSIISTLLYDPESFLDFDFYRRDGNLFTSYLSLYALLGVRFVYRPSHVLLVFSIVSTAIYLIWFGIYVGDEGFDLASVLTEQQGSFPGLFDARNASGGFLAVVASMSIGYLLVKRNRIYMAITAIALICLLFTYSRGSIMGLAAAFGLLMLHRRGYRRVVPVALALAVVGSIAVAGFYLAQTSQWTDTYDEIGLFGDVSGKEGNVESRAKYYWPKALAMFNASPFLGMGFGSFDDAPVIIDTVIPGFFAVNGSHARAHTALHAHNSTLHFLAETGLAGLALFIWLMREVYRRIQSIRRYNKAIASGLLLAGLTIVCSSFTEHRIVTPSMMMPFVLMFGISASYARVAEQARRLRRRRLRGLRSHRRRRMGRALAGEAPLRTGKYRRRTVPRRIPRDRPAAFPTQAAPAASHVPPGGPAPAENTAV